MAVVGIQDELKGQLPCAFFVLNKAKVEEKEPNSAEKEPDCSEKVKSELVQMVRKEVGAVAAFKMAIAVKDIPRTRSGKTPRKVIADLASGRDFKVIFYNLFQPEILKKIFHLFSNHKKKKMYDILDFGYFWKLK